MVQVIDRVGETIEQNGLLGSGEKVVVGVSGGPDSLCLLHILCRLAGELHLSLHVAHLHHGLRGADADADAEFVRALAADWGLPCTVEGADVPALAREQRLAFEEAARRARYAFLARTAAHIGAHTIAVGHNADDQAETVLMHFLRGSGLAGLRGMLPLTPLSDYRLLDPSHSESQLPNPQSSKRPIPNPLIPNLIRPLLDVTRAEIKAYCDYYHLEPRFDRSNLDTTYFRNWLRLEVIPLLQEHNPNVQGVMRRSAQVIAADYALLRSLLEDAWGRVVVDESLPQAGRTEGGRIVLDLEAWRALTTSLQRATLREVIHRLRRSLRNINFLHVENALRVARDGTTGDQATLPQGLLLAVGYDRLTIAAADAAQPLPDWPLLEPGGGPVPVRVPGITLLEDTDWALEAGIQTRFTLPAGWEANADPWRAFLDAGFVGPLPVLRTRQPGDRFQPLGMGDHSVKLADFLINQKVPRAARDRLPLLVGQAGIAWVCGQRVDERARVRDGTGPVLVVRFVRL
jgi:tRNA(Ile)-lysidine synthase